MDAEWQKTEGEDGQYMAEIKIYGNNRVGLLVDITKILTECQIDIRAIHSNTSKQGIATITLSFNIKGRAYWILKEPGGKAIIVLRG